MSNDTQRKLTPEEEALMPVVAQEWIDLAINSGSDVGQAALEEGCSWLWSKVHRTFKKVRYLEGDLEQARAWVKECEDAYKAGKKVNTLTIVVFDSPKECLKAARDLVDPDAKFLSIGIGNYAGWAAYYDAFERIGMVDDDDYRAYRSWLKMGKVWDLIAFDTLAMICRRPHAVRKDDQGRLHHPTRPAIEFRDGYGVTVWHGEDVPEDWILRPETVDPMLALTYPQIEKRRALAEILGWDKVLSKLADERGVKQNILDTDPNPMVGQLFEMEIPDSGREKFIRVMCGTGREFVLPADPQARTALEANARSYGITPEQMREMKIRT